MMSIDRYLSKTYDIKSYNCLHLACEVWWDLTGTDLTPYLGSVLTPGKRILTSKVRKPFTRIPVPTDPCLVYMRHRPLTPHIGVFTQGRVIHIDVMGARFEDLSVATMLCDDVRFYVCR